MITVGSYIKLILNKKGKTQQYLVDKMNELGLSDGQAMHYEHLSTNLTTNKITPELARKIEIALELEKNFLVKMVGIPTNEKGLKRLEDIENRAINSKK
jgi:transcriptional regulator with XRE-family HTH domain